MKRNFTSISTLSNSYTSNQAFLARRATGIIRQRAPRRLDDDTVLETNPRTDELIAKFLVTHGLPFDSIHDRSFKQLLYHLNPNVVFPQPKVLEANIERLGNPTKPIINYAKSVGPLTVTVDVAGDTEEKFLCFSIHFFEDYSDRKNVVYLRRMMLSEVDMDAILTTIRRAVSNYSYSNVRFTNIVCPNVELLSILCASDVIKRGYVCFHNYMTGFVHDMFKIEEFAAGIEQLRAFVRFMRKHPDLYSKFRREQLTRNAELDLPLIGDGSWDQTTIFLTRCLILHEAFTQFSERWHVKKYITHSKFDELIFLQRILQQCVKFSRELSVPLNSISQVVPAVMSMRNFLTTHTQGYSFEKKIRDAFTNNFQQLTNGDLSARYDMATILDPRFAYREHIYSSTVWTNIEKKLIEDFAMSEATCERSFNFDIVPISYEDRKAMIIPELKKYRQFIVKDRPDENQSVFHWWGRYQTEMEILVVMAREFLASPAVTINANYYFSDGGKFKHLCKSHNHQVLENSLTVAGANQVFRGRGACQDHIPPHLIELLNNTVFRRQEERKKGLDPFTGTMGRDYPPLPNMDPKRLRFDDEDHLGMPSLAPEGSEQKPLQTIDEIMGEESKPEASLHADVAFFDAVKEEQIDEGYGDVVPPKTSSPPANSPALPSVRVLSTNAGMTPLPAQAPKVVYPAPKPKIIGTAKPKPIVINGQTRFAVVPPQLHGAKPANILRAELTSLENERKVPMAATTSPATGGPIRPHPVLGNPPKPLIRPLIGKPLVGKPLVVKPLVGKQLPPIANKPVAQQVAQPVAQPTPPPPPPAPQIIQKHNFTQKFAQKQNFVNKFVSIAQNGRSDLREPKEEPNRLHNETKFDTTRLANEVLKQEMKNMSDEEEEDEYNGNLYTSMMDQRPHIIEPFIKVRKPCNRRCCVCNQLEEHNNLKNVTVETEKIVVVLGAVYRKELTILEARAIIDRLTKTYMCRVHFLEACDEVFRMLHVKRPADIAVAKLDLISNALISVNSIGPRNMSPSQLRQMFIVFTEKYCEEPPKMERSGNHLTFDDLAASELADFDDQEILPKAHRQPRKQVLEVDQTDSTVKVIEQEDFKLPQVDPSENTNDCDNPEDCCFCLIHADRSSMLRVPKSEDRLARWLHKLGPEFAARIRMDADNYICRSHFPEEAFSSRGRLLKGQLPTALPKKVETSYKLDLNTGDFMKLAQRKSGTQKDSNINLATIATSKAGGRTARMAKTKPQAKSQTRGSRRKSQKWQEEDDLEYDVYEENTSDSDYQADEPGPSTKARMASSSASRSETRSLTPAATSNAQAPVLFNARGLVFGEPPEESPQPESADEFLSLKNEAATTSDSTQELIAPKDEGSSGLVEPKEENPIPIKRSARLARK